MAVLNEQLRITTGQGDSFEFLLTEQYNEVFRLRTEVDNSDTFVTLVTPSTSIGTDPVGGQLNNVKSMVIKNDGLVGAEVQLQITDYKNNSNVDAANSIDVSGEGASTTRFMSFLLGAGEYVFLPNARWVGYEEDMSAANAKPTTAGTYLTLDSNLYVASGAVIDGSGMASDATVTTVVVDDNEGSPAATTGYFHVGDLIQAENEIMEVTAVAANTGTEANLTVVRGLYGTTAATHADNIPIRFPFFNAYNKKTAYANSVQTDKSGQFKAFNFFGFGRVNTGVSEGIVPGSVAGKFYEPAYQELGLSGITPGTETGLAASTTYAFGINSGSGGTVFEVEFTTDASNTRFGGANGVLKKIQDVLDAAYYNSDTSGGADHIFEEKITVDIVNGDVRFTSGERLSTGSIVLSTKTGSGADWFGVGRINTLANCEGSVLARVPGDTIINSDGVTVPNTGAFFFDDGLGRITGTAEGTINYLTGKIDFTGPPSANFVITASYDSAHGGGNVTTAAKQNMITKISARSCNSKLNCPIQVVAFN